MTESLKRSGSRTWMYITGAVAVVALAVLITISASGDSGSTPDQLAGVDEVTALFSGIPQKGLAVGKDDAPVTITEYLDIQCSHCASASVGTIPTIVRDHVKTGEVKLVMQPISIIGPESETAGLAVIAAGNQDQAWQMADVLFRNRGAENGGWVTEGLLNKVATSVGLDAGKLDGDRGSDAVKKTWETARESAKTAGVQGTPTIIVKGSKGQYTVKDYGNISEIKQAIAAVK